MTKPVHVAWGKIGLFNNVIRVVRERYAGGACPVIRYRAKVKLHGTNCGVQAAGGEVYAQSRNGMLTPSADMFGFAAWAQRHREYFVRRLGAGDVVFGEWCGPGIQRGMAISAVSTNLFVVFAVRRGDRVIVDPDEIRAVLSAAGAPKELHVSPWEGEAFAVDFESRAALDAVAEALNVRVESIEREDPWVRRTFGVSGVGEGLVLFPVAVGDGPAPEDPEGLLGLMFKAKGEQHRTVGVRAAAQVDASKVASVGEFVDLVVTPARLEQGLVAIGGGAFAGAKVRRFIAWVAADVRKETVDELAASGLVWAQVEKAVEARARAWFLARSR